MTPARIRAALCLTALAAGLTLSAWGLVGFVRAHIINASIATLQSGHDLDVASSADPLLLSAKARFLLVHGSLAAAQVIADDLAGVNAPHPQAALLIAIANARMRRAYALFAKVPFWKVKPEIALAKSQYRLALTLDPDDWDARYNYAVAASLVRDTEQAAPTAGTGMAHERAVWPDIPGAPNGMP